MAQTIKTTFQLRRGLEENWIKNNPILAQGEPGFAIDRNKFKIGDGIKTWQELEYTTLTKEEITDLVLEQIASAGHLERVIVEQLPELEAAKKDTIYMVKKTGGLVSHDFYEEFMVIEGAWEKIGDTYVDLTGYASSEEVAKRLAIIEEDYKRADKNLDMKIIDLENIGAQANVIEQISTDDGALEILEKNVKLPKATIEKLGLVRGSNEENAISVNEDGKMYVNSLNVNNLVQTKDEYLILNGGSALD